MTNGLMGASRPSSPMGSSFPNFNRYRVIIYTIIIIIIIICLELLRMISYVRLYVLPHKCYCILIVCHQGTITIHLLFLTFKLKNHNLVVDFFSPVLYLVLAYAKQMFLLYLFCWLNSISYSYLLDRLLQMFFNFLFFLFPQMFFYMLVFILPFFPHIAV